MIHNFFSGACWAMVDTQHIDSETQLTTSVLCECDFMFIFYSQNATVLPDPVHACENKNFRHDLGARNASICHKKRTLPGQPRPCCSAAAGSLLAVQVSCW
jgi:hypothetical protein